MPADTVVLASASTARRALLEAAGIRVSVCPSGVDEAAWKHSLAGRGAAEVASALAAAKAEDVSKKNKDAVVIGADQTLALGDRLFDKPPTLAAAREQLISLRNNTHTLHSAVAIASDGRTIWQTVETARLTMRNFSDAFLEDYLAQAGLKVCTSVGAYQLEALGLQLFSAIDGDHTTILGLPMLPLLEQLRRLAVIPT